jgi:hypothetical protein
MRTVTVALPACVSLARHFSGSSATGTCSNTTAFIVVPFFSGPAARAKASITSITARCLGLGSALMRSNCR